MKKIGIVYYTSTGNTEAMANAIVEGVKENNGDVTLYNVSEITPDEALNYDVLVLGCPAMGAEVLEEGEMEPWFTELEANLAGKDVALFGSYGWGDGEWMRNWQERVVNSGANLLQDGVICMNDPDDEAIEALHALGAKVASL